MVIRGTIRDAKTISSVLWLDHLVRTAKPKAAGQHYPLLFPCPHSLDSLPLALQNASYGLRCTSLGPPVKDVRKEGGTWNV